MSNCERMTKMGWLGGLFAFFLLLSLVDPCTGDTGPQTVVVFKGGSTEIPYKTESGAKAVHKPSDFRVPAFVGGVVNNKEFLAVICGASLRDSSGYPFAEGVASTSYGNHNKWTDPEIFTADAQRSTTHRLLGDFTAVMKGNKIYVLASSFGIEDTLLPGGSSDNRWEPFMFVGTVTDSGSSAGMAASVKWEAGKSIKTTLLKGLLEAQATQFIGAVGNSIVTKSGAIVFPVRMDQKERQFTSTIVYSGDEGATWKIGKMTEIGTFDGSVVEWGEGKLLFVSPSEKGYRKAFESEDMGTTWKESLVFSRVWGNEQGRTGYGRQGSAIKVPVDGRDVLLFSHPSNEKGGSSADTLRLWLSDGQRIVRVGQISEGDKEQSVGNSILAHVGDHLYITREINPLNFFDSSVDKLQQWDGVIGFTPLPQFFESAKATVRAWRELDTKYKAKGVPTEGLVGFLGNAKKDNTVWEDTYKCVHATVKGGERVSGGFRFSGAPGSGAQWPVQSQGQNQVYIFAEKQFTLAATVTIHAANETGQFSLLGASLDSEGNNVLVGLEYTDDNKWCAVSHEKKGMTTTNVFEREKEYHVALTFANGVADVYVGGVKITKKELKIKRTASISHFYMGGSGQSSRAKGSPCTVKNVMLFNRALEQKEVAGIFKVDKDGEKKRGDGTEVTFSLGVLACLLYFANLLMWL